MNSIDSKTNFHIFCPLNLSFLKLNRLFQGIIESDLTTVQRELTSSQSIDWEETFEGYNLLEWSAIKLNFGDPNAESIFQKIQLSYARSVNASIKKRADNFFSVVNLCMIKRDLFAGCASKKFQNSLVNILKSHLPDSPILSYITEKSLDSIHPDYNANQTLYALWCDLTACALAHRFHSDDIYDLKKYLAFCASSRQLLAETCEMPDALSFGTTRFYKDYISPLATPMAERYLPWLDFNQARAKKRDYKVFARFPIGECVTGTEINNVQYPEYDSTHISWIHGKDPKLHRVAQVWLTHAILCPPDQAVTRIGKFYHTMVQYTPLMRGSATVSMVLMNAMFKYHDIPLPKAVTLLDCYALSMHQREFVQDVFVPLAKGEIDDAGLKELLKQKTAKLTN